jgi:hypothetical protein
MVNYHRAFLVYNKIACLYTLPRLRHGAHWLYRYIKYWVLCLCCFAICCWLSWPISIVYSRPRPNAGNPTVILCSINFCQHPINSYLSHPFCWLFANNATRFSWFSFIRQKTQKQIVGLAVCLFFGSKGWFTFVSSKTKQYETKLPY